jgi:RNA polymerase sigma factor (sigma-70 family)
MPGRQSEDHSNNLSTLFRLGTLAGWSDAQLLEQFVDGRDDASERAFHALVERHGSMVLRVCQCVLGNRHDAEDAFQVTFVVLARKARSIHNRQSLASWLHGVAHHVALRAQTARRRRVAREMKVAKGAEKANTLRQPGDDHVDLPAVLHQEITRLPEKYRAPIGLCYLEGMTHDQAAHALGWPVGTVRGRLARARQLLRTRLNRRGLALPGGLACVGPLADLGSVELPRSLVNAAVRAAGCSAAAGVLPESAALLLAAVLRNMALMRLARPAVALMMIAIVGGGTAVLEYADASFTSDRTAVRQIKVVSAPSVLEPVKPAAWQPDGRYEASAKAVSELIAQLRRHPVKPSLSADRLALHVIDVETGAVTLIADEPAPGLIRCGSPVWSHDGRRIIYDAMPMNEPRATRLKVIELAEGRLKLTDLGPGNCPTFSPADDHIAFLNNSNVGGAAVAVWRMQADGSDRRMLGDYGRPRWSPDDRQMLIVDFAKPRGLMLKDIGLKTGGPLTIAGFNIFWEPSWAGGESIVAAIGTVVPDAIALVDVSVPGHAGIKETLWKKGDGTNVEPFCPLYSVATGRCVFVGVENKRKALYTFRRGQSDPPRRLEREGDDNLLQDLAASPDGRYVLFTSDRRSKDHVSAAPIVGVPKS